MQYGHFVVKLQYIYAVCKVRSLETKHPIEQHEIVQQNNIAPLRINIEGSLKLMDKYGRLEMAVQY